MTAKTVYTPLGSLVLNDHENHIVDLSWNAEHFHEQQSPVLEHAAEEIEAYFNQDLTKFTVPTAFKTGTAFQQKVWQAIAEIPFGETVTYGELAKELGTSPRALGTACDKNPVPLIIPCHRVVGDNGKLTGYSGGDGTLTKRVLLGFEKQAKHDHLNLMLWRELREAIPQKPFYFMRHGETDYNKNLILQGGLIDSSINETGQQQAVKAGKRIAEVFNPSVVWHSELQRTKQTMEGVLSQMPEKQREIDNHFGLNERSFGLFDGKSADELPGLFHYYQCSPEGETWLKVVSRIAVALEDILNKSDETPLIVAHGAVARCMGDLLGAWPQDHRFQNCEAWYVEPPKDGTSTSPWQGKQIHEGGL